MEDVTIVELYWARDPAAIEETGAKYGAYCAAIAQNILPSREDTEECVNDTWLRAWNAIPPSRPNHLSAFLGKITRNLALNRSKHNAAEKRGGGQAPVVLDELGELVSGKDSVEQALDHAELRAAIDAFLAALPRQKRQLFVCRYWYFDSIADIAARYRMTENHVSVTLSRLRSSLRQHLTERGFEL